MSPPVPPGTHQRSHLYPYMSAPSIYEQAADVYERAGATQRDVAKLPPIQLSHWPIMDTALAACLATLGIPFREPAPFTDDVDAASGHRRTCFWLADHAPAENPEDQHRTEELVGAWAYRARFEIEHRLHPINAMRAALDAREWWVRVIHRQEPLPGETRERDPFLTNNLRHAAILKACGFRPLGFTGRAFLIEGRHDLLPAQALIEAASLAEGASAEQWMFKVLLNFEHLISIAKANPPAIRLREGDETLILRADATRKTRDKFHALLS